MILIVDDRARRRSLILRDLFRAAGVPCALCAFDNMTQFRSAPVTVFFAHDETSVSLAAVRAGRTELVAVNVSGRRMFHPEASVWDGEPDEKLVAFALDLAREKRGIDAACVSAGRLRITPDSVHYGLKLLVLTPTERLILFHLAVNAGRYCPEREVRKFALPADDLRAKSSSVKVHICSINKKAVRAAGEKIICCRRASGYAVITEPAGTKRRNARPGFVPPFR